jgi:hypothetical protein
LLDFHSKSCINYLLGTMYLYYYCWSKFRTFTRPWIYLAKLIIKIWIVPTTILSLLSWKFASYSRNFLLFVGAKVNCLVQNSQPHYSIEIQMNPGYILNPHFVKSILITFSVTHVSSDECLLFKLADKFYLLISRTVSAACSALYILLYLSSLFGFSVCQSVKSNKVNIIDLPQY